MAMERQTGEQYPDEGPYAELQAPGAVVALWRQLGAFATKPVEERERLLDQLGVSTEDIRRAVTGLEHIKDLPVLEPGIRLPAGSPCRISWQPSILAPVFYGIRDLDVATDGAPGRMRLYFPSLDGSPDSAPLLEGCGRYPLVLFLHGECQFDADHFLLWDLLPAQLARSGYVVAVPDLTHNGYPWADSPPDLALAEQILIWLRSSWEHAGVLLPWGTAVVGHSWGALLGARLAVASPWPGFAVTAYASLSGGWSEWPDTPPRPLANIGVPSLFSWGTGFSDVFAAGWWQQPSGAKHKLEFEEGEHWDYLRGNNSSRCATQHGPCSLVPSLAADFVTSFLSHYLPPEKWWLLPNTIPHSLIPPPLNLTPEQEFFAGGHLFGFSEIANRAGCSVTHTWEVPVSMGEGSVTLSGP
jgi:pimeloyl-ACP methyl ester carboxylesterase